MVEGCEGGYVDEDVDLLVPVHVGGGKGEYGDFQVGVAGWDDRVGISMH